MKFISIEGNIGSGKTSLLKSIKEIGALVFEERVGEWTQVNGENVLDLYYGDTHKYGFMFQLLAASSHLKNVHDARKEKREIVLFERSVNSSENVFAKKMVETGIITSLEYTILCQLYEEIHHLVEGVGQQYFIYLNLPPSVAYERVLKRARPEEEGFTVDFLSELHTKHIEWFGNPEDGTPLFNGVTKMSDNVFIVDATRPPHEVVQSVVGILLRLTNPNIDVTPLPVGEKP